MANHTITWADFEQVELRVGTIIQAQVFAEARNPAYKLWVDFGEPLGVKKSSAQITRHYPDPSALLGKQVLCVTNFSPKQVGPFMSEVLVTGLVTTTGDVVLVVPDERVPDGTCLA
ncbi:MAG: tRNA-binding protein [Cyanobacteria bacterium HKST-UBA06]|nr:tRNA-binding protein [Cyanobacteria bacterium HKST-UBA06]